MRHFTGLCLKVAFGRFAQGDNPEGYASQFTRRRLSPDVGPLKAEVPTRESHLHVILILLGQCAAVDLSTLNFEFEFSYRYGAGYCPTWCKHGSERVAYHRLALRRSDSSNYALLPAFLLWDEESATVY